ncbi:CRISPR system Cascade subunit CasE [Methanosarcinales archaeon]|uniref:type I-E CRISPR-associated protein Cas6/Cse3/CasE n=1 Tax=Candidatus Methanoperedens sp. BLZ2 TaxID=2035255 RepID=UPI000BE40676|nr:type I-E CRISPR-associated protein Cas6/Cse3/CasE [Candidatus Methanoperedens sp. BLZ2]KAB2946080.1 MAG: type I-E CRISPR-associated protein Cas6/Cse3/CasE [Candidatus Methanoperedens sp.]MBZ0175022.1 type I-E CRISPR-associated protein Cas6/Cse3/CasE [Candidatus Methanoperedens nitroreducens]CAG0956628.1 CRISPR system Cascade subunit CasE [Methanosarcinales archaeon]MCX9076641.1 type I-E CRISPR-associated protein Cas6/Cse3/CasE [Candidatus Methanoperedens sp.]MCX9089436.1 type I-E CRISPR-ass
MYYSQCVLNSVKPVNPYLLHEKIWQLFPDKADEKRSFLFRVENLGQRGVQHILLMSSYEPQPANGELILLNKPKKVQFDGITNGGNYRFMLRANPTKRIKDSGGKTSNQGKVRVPIIDEEEIIAWLNRQLKDLAEIKAVTLARQDLLYFQKNKGNQNHFGKIQTVTYSGILTVIEAKLLVNKMIEGIGPAKAFGCGLLTLAKI